MDDIFQELKSAREAKGITLSQISDATMIGVQFLEAIELGNVTVLPQTYVRAFIREYALVIGLDPHEVILKYDRRHNPDAPGTESLDHPAPAESGRRATTSLTEPAERRIMTPRIARGLMVAALVCATVVGLWNIVRKEQPGQTEEIPFQNVVKENELRISPPASERPGGQSPSVTLPGDSLILRATATDSAWISVIVDQQQERDYLFTSGGRGAWKARDRFLLTLGNAGGLQFTLNQKQLGTLGTRGSVLRNVELNRQTLAQK